MASDLSELRRKTQESLISFLTVELDLARTYCEMIQRIESQERKAKLLGNVLKIVEAIRHFQERIADQTVREHVLRGTAKLEKFIAQHSQ